MISLEGSPSEVTMPARWRYGILGIVQVPSNSNRPALGPRGYPYQPLTFRFLLSCPYALAGCGKTRFEADSVPRNALVSTAQPDKKEVCVEKTSSSWMCSAT